MTEEQTKKCVRCGEIKSLTEYNKNSRKEDGLSAICRDCKKRESKKYVGRYKEYKSKYYRDNEDYIKQKSKAWAEQNKDKQIQNYKRWRVFNQEKINKNRQRWLLENPERARLAHILSTNKRRRAKNATENRATIEQINKLIVSSNNICFWCEDEIPNGMMHIDHIYPLAKGGKDDINNLVVSCQSCNCRKGAKNPEDFLEEILVDKRRS